MRAIDDLVASKTLTNPGLDPADFIQPATDTLTKFKGKTYGFLNWNYNVVYWARGDLLGHPEERAAFKKRYGHDLGPARTLQQWGLAEFFTGRRASSRQDLETTLRDRAAGSSGNRPWVVLNAFIRLCRRHLDVLAADRGLPRTSQPSRWAGLWKWAPPGRRYSLTTAPVMGNASRPTSVEVSCSHRSAGQVEYREFVYAGRRDPARPSETEPGGFISKHSSSGGPTTFSQWVGKATQKQLFREIVRRRGSEPTTRALRRSAFAVPGLYSAMRESLRTGAKPKAPKMYET